MRFDTLRFVVGQTTDIIAPLVPATLNMYPWSYAPGNLGFFHPQIRVETSMRVGAEADLGLQGGIAQASQTFDPETTESVAAQGFWIEAEQRVRPPVVVHGGYGLDNVEDADLGAVVSRKLNQVIYGNAFYELSPELSIAGEVAWCRTDYRLEPDQDASSFRLEFAIIDKWFSR